MSRLAAAVIGCGIIARARYFPALHALIDLFDVRALCDTDPAALDHARLLFPTARTYAHLGDLLADHAGSDRLDCVFLLTSGDHTEPLATLARYRLATLTEKPLAYTHTGAQQSIDAFEHHGVPLQVGYMKRYYDAVGRLVEVIAREGVTNVAIDLVHPPEDSYLTPVIGHGRATTSDLPSFLDAEAARPDLSQLLTGLGVAEADACARRGYVLLATSAIHDVNLLRALLGEPSSVPFAQFWNGGLCGRVLFAWSEDRTACLTYSYVDTGGYEETIRLTAPRGRWALHMPSPYLAHAPAVLRTVRGSGNGLPVHSTDPVCLADPFEQQIRAFHHTIRTGHPPRIDAIDAAADLTLIERIVAAAARASSPRS